MGGSFQMSGVVLARRFFRPRGLEPSASAKRSPLVDITFVISSETGKKRVGAIASFHHHESSDGGGLGRRR